MVRRSRNCQHQNDEPRDLPSRVFGTSRERGRRGGNGFRLGKIGQWRNACAPASRVATHGGRRGSRCAGCDARHRARADRADAGHADARDPDAERAAAGQHREAVRCGRFGQYVQPVRRTEGRLDPEQLADDGPDAAGGDDRRQPEFRAGPVGADHRQPGQQQYAVATARLRRGRGQSRRSRAGQQRGDSGRRRRLHQHQPRDADHGPAPVRRGRFACRLSCRPRPHRGARVGPERVECRSGRPDLAGSAGECPCCRLSCC